MKKTQPTDSELEILGVLWQKGKATVREVHEQLEEFREVGYTTTLKTMQIMTEKGLVARDTSSRTHVYTPLVTREGTQNHFFTKMIDGLFSGSASRMVMGAISSEKISREEIEEIKRYLEKFENQ